MNGSYGELQARWKRLRERGVRVREVACVGAPRTLLCAEAGDHASPAIAIAAGVHGDEPAGAWALLELVESGALDPSFRLPPLAVYESHRLRCGYARERRRHRYQSHVRAWRPIAGSARHRYCKSRSQVRALSRFARRCRCGGILLLRIRRRRDRAAVVAALDEAGLADRSARRNLRHGRPSRRRAVHARTRAHHRRSPHRSDAARRSFVLTCDRSQRRTQRADVRNSGPCSVGVAIADAPPGDSSRHHERWNGA